MSRPTYSRVPVSEPETGPVGSTSARTLSRQESDSNLAPRTPHSRSGGQSFRENAVVDFDSDDLQDGVNDSYALTQQSQLAPLLASSASASFGDDIHLRAHQPSHTGSRSQRYPSAWSFRNIITYLPLILGVSFSVLLCILIFISITWPNTLQGLVSEAPTPSHSPDILHNSTVTSGGNTALNETISTHNHSGVATKLIDYSAYTTFPLTPEQYRVECWKQQAKHFHGGYWAKPPCKLVLPRTQLSCS
jgi:hypothetical protein